MLTTCTVAPPRQSQESQRDFKAFSLDDVASVLGLFRPLKYSQPVELPSGITITPYAAGHTIGGAVWKGAPRAVFAGATWRTDSLWSFPPCPSTAPSAVTKDSEDIVYAVDYNHTRERHLDGTVLETLLRPSLLITDAYNANKSAGRPLWLSHVTLAVPSRISGCRTDQAKRADRDNALRSHILTTVRGGGSVMVASDTAGRCG